MTRFRAVVHCARAERRTVPRTGARLVGGVVGAIALVVIASCGSEDLIFPGDFPATETPTPAPTVTCLASGDACSVGTDCCSGQCITTDGVDLFCQ
jgi:hypothetical protein